jgi:hypothetical protein
MRQFGVDDIATKPLDPIKLGEIIQRLTGKAQSQTDLPSRSVPKTEIAAEDLCESGLRLWTQLAQRSPELAELFSLSDEPASPEDFQRVLDIADVIERSGDSVRRTMLIFRSFLDCFREQLHKLHEAKNAKQLEELRFASHALKGLLLDIGARVSANLASSIEQMSKEGLGEEAFAPVGKLTKQILLVARLVTQLCEAGGATEGSHENTNVAEVVELPNTDE